MPKEIKTISVLNYEGIPCYDYMDGYKRWADYLEIKKGVNLTSHDENECREILLNQIELKIEAINKKRKRKLGIIGIEFFTVPSRDIIEYWYVFWGK